MTFRQQILATLIGTIAGFIFSLVLFYVREKWTRKTNKKLVLDNAKFEIDFYISILKSILNNINKVIEKITVNDKIAYVSVDYSRLTYVFLATLYQTGLMKEKLLLEEIDKLNSIILRFKAGNEAYINNTLQKYRTDQLDQKNTLTNVTYERKLIEEAIKDLEKIKIKIKP